MWARDPDRIAQRLDPVRRKGELVQHRKLIAADRAVLDGIGTDRKPLTRIGQ
jgi:hypothetical protein